ncbi:malate dehydrogenase, mitochondrial [Nomia melanderi]|uniref:malate dehydrogenase, mitochondrial n=1 Tax=Nomia melanderi TaxID=2448451 RepID=UPI003FCD02A5
MIKQTGSLITKWWSNPPRICLFTQYNYFSSKSMKVAILGAASKTGSCLSLFLKQSSLIEELAIFDNKCTYGLAWDLNYIDTKCKVSTCNSSEACLKQTLEGAKIVMIVADHVTKKRSDGRPDHLLKYNADTLSDLLPNVIKYCPQAMVAVAMHPINSLIPLAIEMYKQAGVHDYNHLFGLISVNCLRANTFAAEVIGVEPECVTIPVIGGSCSETCIPIFSQAKPCNVIAQEEARRLTRAVRLADEEVSKMNKKPTSFAMAFGAARFCVSLCKALRHQRDVVEYAYVRSHVIPEIKYFAGPLKLGPDGIQKHLGIPPLNDYESKLLKVAVPALKNAILLGEDLALGHENYVAEANQANPYNLS